MRGIGACIGLNASFLNIVTEWLSDIKLGHCSTAFYLNENFCCWGAEDGGLYLAGFFLRGVGGLIVCFFLGGFRLPGMESMEHGLASELLALHLVFGRFLTLSCLTSK